MANNTIIKTKNGKYLKKTDANSYVHYQFDTNDGVVYLSDKIDGANGSGADYAKDVTLHRALSALYTLASKGGQASIDLAELSKLVGDHLNSADNPHNVKPAQIGLGSVVNAPMDPTPTANSNNYVQSGGVYTAIQNVSDTANQAISIANGQSHAYVFANVNGLMAGTLSNGQTISKYKVGDSIYIISTDVSDFWISAIASTGTASDANVINSAKKGNTVIVKWGSDYVSLTAFESKRDLSGYVTTSALNTKLNDYYNKKTSDDKYVPYSDAKNDVNIGNHTITVGNATVQGNPVNTKIAGGNITLNGLANLPTGTTTTTVGRKVEINVTGITVDDNKKYNYPLNSTGTYTLATQEYVTGKGYQTVSGVKSVIGTAIGATTGDVTFSGSVDNGITSTLSNTGIHAGIYSALAVDSKGRATAGYQQIRFASNINDPILNDLVVGGVAIVDAE